jgi:ketosteroid isomerase-like protein
MTARTSIPTLLCFAVIALQGCAGAPEESDPAPVDMDAARAEVLAVEGAINQAVDGLDCAGALAPMREAGPLFVSSGFVVQDREELAAICEQMIAPRTGAEFSDLQRTATMLSADVAMVVREGNYTVHLKDGTSTEQYLAMTTIWTHESDGWKMVHLHESVRPDAQ